MEQIGDVRDVEMTCSAVLAHVGATDRGHPDVPEVQIGPVGSAEAVRQKATDAQ